MMCICGLERDLIYFVKMVPQCMTPIRHQSEELKDDSSWSEWLIRSLGFEFLFPYLERLSVAHMLGSIPNAGYSTTVLNDRLSARNLLSSLL